jgi:hypothetical protein
VWALIAANVAGIVLSLGSMRRYRRLRSLVKPVQIRATIGGDPVLNIDTAHLAQFLKYTGGEPFDLLTGIPIEVPGWPRLISPATRAQLQIVVSEVPEWR